MIVNVFGSTSLVGCSFVEQVKILMKEYTINCYSRSSTNDLKLDLLEPNKFKPSSLGSDSLWISFAPIWDFSSFLNWLYINKRNYLNSLKGLIVCSSSSVITKRFSFNSFDKKLVKDLKSAEDRIISICSSLEIPFYIIRPTLIYGEINEKVDKNINTLIKIMRKNKFIPLPSDTGLRQPIHISQLSLVSIKLLGEIELDHNINRNNRIINLGGDSQISYRQMLVDLQNSLPLSDHARNCKIVSFPNRFYLFLASILLLKSPKFFEAVQRIMVDLAGFTSSCEILHVKPQKFPLK